MQDYGVSVIIEPIIHSYTEAIEYLYSHIHPYQKKFNPAERLQKLALFFDALGNPQEQMQVVHIAGTSGKGSTAHILDNLLRAHSLKTGLFISPHIIDIRERFQVNGKLISEQLFVQYLNEAHDTIEKIKITSGYSLHFFDLITLLGFYIFAKQKVDVAVIETGIGGLYDGTNCVHNPSKIAILTNIGLDHTEILGTTIPEIAIQKAGIIQEKNTVIALNQSEEVLELFQQRAKEKSAALQVIGEGRGVEHITLDKQGTFFTYHVNDHYYSHLMVSARGSFQAENAALGITALFVLGPRLHFSVSEEKIRSALITVHLQARMEIYEKNEKTIILDGAHNPQKMEAFINSVKELYPGKGFSFIIGFSHNKEYIQTLEPIIPIADHIYILDFFKPATLSNLPTKNVDEIKEELNSLDYTNVTIIENTPENIQEILEKNTNIIVTGSFYLMEQLYPMVRKLFTLRV